MQVIEYMNKNGYFKCDEEYRKCLMWAEKGMIPEFLQKDYEHYREKLKEKRKIGKYER